MGVGATIVIERANPHSLARLPAGEDPHGFRRGVRVAELVMNRRAETGVATTHAAGMQVIAQEVVRIARAVGEPLRGRVQLRLEDLELHRARPRHGRT